MLDDSLPQVINNSKPDDLSARLAFDLAARLRPLPDILDQYGLTEDALKTLLRTPAFANMVKEAKQVWASEMNAIERIQTKSRIALEELIPDIYQTAASMDMSVPARMEASKLLAKLSGFDTKQNISDNDAVGRGFSITINLGKEEPVVIDGAS